MDQDDTSKQLIEGILKDMTQEDDQEDVFVPVTPASQWNSNNFTPAYIKPEDCLKHLSDIIKDTDTAKGIRVNAIKIYLEKYEMVQQQAGNTTVQNVGFTFNVINPKNGE